MYECKNLSKILCIEHKSRLVDIGNYFTISILYYLND